MPAVPDCLRKRYQALDGMIKELGAVSRCNSTGSRTSDPGVKLMCDFWNILEEDPNCNLPARVHQCFCPNSAKPSVSNFPPQRITCYMANEGSGGPDRAEVRSPAQPHIEAAAPLSKVLCNLKKAASSEKDCNDKLKELLAAEKHLRTQIAHLETKEKEGTQLLKEADTMWSNMEDAYKEKIAASLGRQKELLKEFQEIEKSAAKWKKNQKDLESQLDSINKCQNEIIEKINQKTNDLKSIDTEIEGFKKRIDITKAETEAVKKTLSNKKQASDTRIAKIAQEISKLEKEIQDEVKIKKEKEKEGNGFIKEARDDLQQLCKVLLQKKLENEDLKAEKNALIQEINTLKDTCDLCKDRCKNKQISLGEEIIKVNGEIQNFKLKCVRCSQCVDTADARKFCIDCPRCANARNCLIEGDKCSVDAMEECVCQTVKQKFLDNVFENMYTVLEKQIQTDAGKALAGEIVNCLKKSRNGKLNERTRRILQEFVLTTVKKNLNLTIVGGAVKTRCEMDAETYQQLMVCLKHVKATPVPKTDKGTDVKKDPCERWGGPSECNCPSGPQACICTKKAPPPPKDPTPCPPAADPEDAGEVVQCPHKKSEACGPDCGGHNPNRVGAEIAEWRPDPCSGPSCPYGKNMRAAQCVLGPESLVTLDRPSRPGLPRVPDISILDDQIECKCGNSPVKPCVCPKDQRTIPRQHIIDEVMGRYVEVTPIEKVATVCNESRLSDLSETSEDRVRLNKTMLNYSTDTKFTNHPTEHLLEDLWIKKPSYIQISDETDYFFTKNKFMSFPEYNERNTSQETLSATGCSDDNSTVTKTMLIHNISKKPGSEWPSEPKQVGLDVSKKCVTYALSKQLSTSFSSLDVAMKDNDINVTVTRKVVDNIVQNVVNDLRNCNIKPQINEKLASSSVEWVTVDSLLKNIEFLDDLKNKSQLPSAETRVGEGEVEMFSVLPKETNRFCKTTKYRQVHIVVSKNNVVKSNKNNKKE